MAVLLSGTLTAFASTGRWAVTARGSRPWRRSLTLDVVVGSVDGIILLQDLESTLVGFGRSALAPRISGEASAPQPSASPTPKSLTVLHVAPEGAPPAGPGAPGGAGPTQREYGLPGLRQSAAPRPRRGERGLPGLGEADGRAVRWSAARVQDHGVASTCGAGRGMRQRWPCGRCTRNRGATGVRARAEGARTSVARMRVPSWDSAWLPWPLTDEGWSQTISAAARARHMGWWVGQGRGQPLAAPRAPLLGRDAARQPLPPSRASLAQQRRSFWGARLGGARAT